MFSALNCRNRPVRQCIKGDYVESAVLQLDPIHVHIGSVFTLSSKRNPSSQSSLKISDTITVRLVIFDIDLPLCQGQQVRSTKR